MTADEIKALTKSKDYYNRYDKSKKWRFISILAGRAMQSAEINEIQHIFEDKIKALGNAIYHDGSIIEGCTVSYSPASRKANLDSGRVVIDGLIYDVEAAELSLSDDAQIGIWLKHDCVTEYEDASLTDPARNMPQFQLPGGYRIVTTAEWSLNTDGNIPFFPVYEFSGGEITARTQEITSPEYLATSARYDRHAHGSYIVEGLKVTALASNSEGKQTFSISEGEAHIHGYEAVIPHSVRLIIDGLPDLAPVKSEVHKYTNNTISLNHAPIEAVDRARVTKERTVIITHGNYTGCTDELPDASIFEVIEVKQDEKIFVNGRDFYFISDKLDWSLLGDEPAPYSTYTVKYHYRLDVLPDGMDRYTITLSGLVPDSLVEVDYSYRMPRKDILVMYRDGSFGVVKGVSHSYAPVLPSTPPEALCLAEISQTWNGLPDVRNTAMQCVHADTIHNMEQRINDLYALVAKNEQRYSAALNAPSTAFNIFTDPLFDDTMKESGSALIADNTLQLSSEKGILTLALNNDETLPYESVAVLEQTAHSRSVRINP